MSLKIGANFFRVWILGVDVCCGFDGLGLLMGEDTMKDVLANAWYWTEAAVSTAMITASPLVLNDGFQEDMIMPNAVNVALVDITTSTCLEELRLQTPHSYCSHP
jgi:hypothetical protein